MPTKTLPSLVVATVALLAVSASAQSNLKDLPPKGIQADATELGSLKKKLQAFPESQSPDVTVFSRAVELAIQQNLFYRKGDLKKASELLDFAVQRNLDQRNGDGGLKLIGYRADAGDKPQPLVGGFVSDIDGSVQPYGIVLPAGFDPKKRYRLDVWLHGRGDTKTEIPFLIERMTKLGQYTPDETIVLHPFGRHCNAFKFAGEIDVLEALRYVQSRLSVDPDRISVRGFSMGGAACWQFATHYSDRWFAANPGAGFSETPEFLKFFQDENVRETAPPYQQRLWQLYDCPPWAGNLAQCPTIAYSGEIDRQKQAADVMEATMKKLDVDLVHVIGPETAHKIHPDSMIEIESRMDDLARFASRETPRHVHFTTVTLRYHKMNWVNVQGLGEHWTPAHVTAKIEGNSIHVVTENVTALRLEFRPGQWPGAATGNVPIEIDGKNLDGPRAFSDRSWSVDLARQDGKWSVGKPASALRKRPGLQGPIDDALMSPFLFVLPTGRSDDAVAQTWYETESEHAMLHWRKHFRGDIQAIFDTDLTAEQIASNNLILFGDARSNGVIRELLKELPVRWNDQTLSIGDSEVPSAGHVPLLVYPNPMNSNRYVVLNSGFTYREYDYLNNARQTPKLPDWALIDVRDGATTQDPGKVKAAGFFDENWQP